MCPHLNSTPCWIISLKQKCSLNFILLRTLNDHARITVMVVGIIWVREVVVHINVPFPQKKSPNDETHKPNSKKESTTQSSLTKYGTSSQITTSTKNKIESTVTAEGSPSLSSGAIPRTLANHLNTNILTQHPEKTPEMERNLPDISLDHQNQK